MEQTVRYLKKQDYKRTHWSGGETVEICLFPIDGQYQVGAFEYRVSSATIELYETVFSKLSGYNRIIMSLTQPIELYHGQDKVHLLPFQPYYFNGGIETKSVGTCIDFNVIYTPDFNGKLAVYHSGEDVAVVTNRHYIIYAINHVQCYDVNQELIEINSGDSIQFVAQANGYWKVVSQESLGCIVVEMYKSSY